MRLWVTVNFACACLKDLGVVLFCKFKHVDRAEDAGPDGLYRIFLIVDGTCRTSHVVDFVNSKFYRFFYIVFDQAEVGIIQQIRNVTHVSCVKVVKTGYIAAFV